MKVSSVFALAAALAVPTGSQPIDDNNVPSIDDKNFIGRIMDAHWYWRRIHCAQDLTWDPELAKAALESVNACTKMPQHVGIPSAVLAMLRNHSQC
jgi:uncharacterized protein YkwD